MGISFDIKIDTKQVKDMIDSMQKQLDQLPDEAYNYFKSVTPIDTGNARRSTSKSGDTINAHYPYAERLDKGWSKQAPKGMVKPTEQFIQKRIKKITGTK